MSQSKGQAPVEKNWNTKEIREFKKAFQIRQDYTDSFIWLAPPPKTAIEMRRDAIAMLVRRQTAASKTLNAMTTEQQHGGKDWDVLKELEKSFLVLFEKCSPVINAVIPPDAAAPVLDASTKTAIAAVDEWIAFEARCLSIRNQMTASESEPGLREKLAARAANLRDLATTLSGKLIELGKISQPLPLVAQLNDVVDKAGARGIAIQNARAFSGNLDKYQKFLLDLSLKVSAEKGSPEDLLATTMKKAFNITTTSAETKDAGPAPKIPYRQLLAAFAMVPSDHAMNAMLDKVVMDKLDDGGGDYKEDQKRIRIDRSLDLGKVEAYRNPETGEDEPVNSFAITTLHEIGHSVDSAYGVMTKHGGKDGCGGWEEVDPLSYYPDAYPQFSNALLQATGTPAALRESLSQPETRSLFARFLFGGMKQEELCKELLKLWEKEIAEQSKRTDALMSPAINGFFAGISAFFKRDDHVEQPVSERLGLFEQACASQIIALTTHNPAVFEIADMRAEFAKVFKPAETAPPGATSGKSFDDWAGDRFVAWTQRNAESSQARHEQAAAWAGAVPGCLPQPMDQTAYLAAARPWEKDISGDKINDKKASHEAYKGDARWWRYAKDDRSGTFVTSYQWRAPGEWFAELYAITWFKQVEPPAKVGKDVRPYMFGGSMA